LRTKENRKWATFIAVGWRLVGFRHAIAGSGAGPSTDRRLGNTKLLWRAIPASGLADDFTETALKILLAHV
jgi:hypothetical protein